MDHHLDIDITFEENGFFTLVMYEPESGLMRKWMAPLSFDEHPEFDRVIGNEIYSWLSLWSDCDEEI